MSISAAAQAGIENIKKGETRVDLINSGINDADAMAIAEVLKSNNTLQTLNLSWNEIKDEGAIELAEALIGNTSLETLLLYDNKGITDKSVPALKEMIISSHITNVHQGNHYEEYLLLNTSVSEANQNEIIALLKTPVEKRVEMKKAEEAAKKEAARKEAEIRSKTIKDAGKKINRGGVSEIDLGEKYLIDEDAIEISKVVGSNTSLKQLDYHGNKITDKGAIAIAESLVGNTTLVKLYLHGNQITNKGMVVIANVLVGNTSLATLTIFGNAGISDNSVPALREMIQNSHVVDMNNFDGCSLSKEAVERLNAWLSIPVEIRNYSEMIGRGDAKVDLHDRQTNDDEAIEIADMIKQGNKTLVELNLEANNITDKGASAIALSLVGNTSLTTLNICNGNKQITDKSIPAFKQMFRSSSVAEMSLDGCSFSEEAKTQFKTWLEGLNEIRRIGKGVEAVELDGKNIDDADAISIAELMKYNSTLAELILDDNQITDEGAIAIATALAGNSTLKSLTLFDNQGITDKSVAALKNMLETSHVTNMGGNPFFHTSISPAAAAELKALLLIPVGQRGKKRVEAELARKKAQEEEIAQKKAAEEAEIARKLAEKEMEAQRQAAMTRRVSIVKPRASLVSKIVSSVLPSGSAASASSDSSSNGFKYRFFISHNWGSEVSKGKFDNHERVSRLNDKLQRLGATTWFDQERLSGNIVEQMCNGIDESEFVVVCITGAYIAKVGQSKNKNDNCKIEFNYAARRKQDHIISVVMDPACLNTLNWTGSVGAFLGGELYLNFTDDKDIDAVAQGLMKRSKKA